METKLLEAMYTIRLEVNYNKNHILEGYLNTILQYRSYITAELTLAEGIPESTKCLFSLLKEDRAKGRQALILDEMVKQGYITKQQATLAKKETLTLPH